MGGRYEPGMFVFYMFIYLFLASLGLHCRAGVLELWRGELLFSCGSHSVASLVVEHGLWRTRLP